MYYMCFHLVLRAWCLQYAPVCMLWNAPVVCKGLMCPALGSVTTHTQCDNVQLRGRESANEIPFGPVCVKVCVHLFVNGTT